MKISIVVPTHEIVPAMFAFDLAQLVSFTVMSMPENTAIAVTFLPGTYIQCARQDLMKHVLYDSKDDYVLWLDSDMRFPKEAFVQLLQRKVAMVGANYSKRGILETPVAIKTIGRNEGETPEKLYTPEGATGLEEVESIGFGCLLMRMDDFRNLPPLTEGPWFEQTYRGDVDQWTGEDTFFCELVREKLGVRIMVDQDLSHAIAHIGQFEYLLAHTQAPVLEEV
jgi:hypothetical protein